MTKTSYLSGFLLCSIILLVSCSKKETENTPAPGPQKDTVTSFMVFFTHTVDSLSEVGAYDDADGPGPKQANIGGIALKTNSNYKVSFRIEDGSNPQKPVMLHNMIKTNGKDYKICIDTPLGITSIATDTDGSLPIGLEFDLSTAGLTGNDFINFTIKYQKGSKNGQCDPGTVYYSCKIPVTVY